MIPDINLIPKLEKNQSDSKLLTILVGIITLLLLTLLIWQYFSARADTARLQVEEANLISQRDALQMDFSSQQSANVGTLEQSIEFVEQVSYAVSPLIDETQNLQPENSYLRDYSFDVESVTITIDFETLSDVSQYVSRLSNSAYFADGHVTSITNNDIGTEIDTENTVNFDVVPRHSADINLLINNEYLATGGVQDETLE